MNINEQKFLARAHDCSLFIPSQDGVKFNSIIPLLWVTLKQSAVVPFSRKEAPATDVPTLSSQRTRREFRIRAFSTIQC